MPFISQAVSRKDTDDILINTYNKLGLLEASYLRGTMETRGIISLSKYLRVGLITPEFHPICLMEWIDANWLFLQIETKNFCFKSLIFKLVQL